MPSGVKNYDVEIDGAIYTTTAATSVTVTGRAPETQYTCRVRARDNAGNVSSWSAPLVVETGDVSGDPTPPSAPTSLGSTNITQTGATISWAASTDNVGVTAYQVEVNGSTIADQSGSTSRNLSGLAADTAQSVRVRAGDAAGNWSGWSSAHTFDTLASGGGGSGTPLAAFSFDEGTGATASDAIGTRDMSGLGAGSGLWVTGHTGSALANGGGNAPTIPSPSGLETASRTLMFWVQRKASNDGWWCQFYIASQDTAAWGIGRIGSNLYCRARVDGSNANLTTSDLPVDEWHHVAITYDGTMFRAYLDGVQFGSQSNAGTLSTADTVKVFDAQAANAIYLDDLRFYDSALNASAVQSAMGTPV